MEHIADTRTHRGLAFAIPASALLLTIALTFAAVSAVSAPGSLPRVVTDRVPEQVPSGLVAPPPSAAATASAKAASATVKAAASAEKASTQQGGQGSGSSRETVGEHETVQAPVREQATGDSTSKSTSSGSVSTQGIGSSSGTGTTRESGDGQTGGSGDGHWGDR